MSEENNATGSMPERLSVRDAGLAFESLLPAEKADKSEDSEAEADESHEDDSESRLRAALRREGVKQPKDESEDEPEESEEKSEDDEDETKDESESDEDEPRRRAPQDPEFTLHIEGKDQQVRLSELRNGYLRQSDYMRKTQALANERKTHDEELGKTRQERSEYAELLPKLRQALETESKAPDWEKLRAENPTEYLVQREQWRDRQESIARIKAEEQRVEAAKRADMEAQSQRFTAEQRQKLRDTEPEFRDEKTAATRSAAIMKLMKSVGFGDNELNVYDHRAIRVLNKAAKYDELMAKLPELRKQTRNAPVVKPDGGSKVPRSAAREANARLSQTGKIRDAAAVFEGFL